MNQVRSQALKPRRVVYATLIIVSVLWLGWRANVMDVRAAAPFASVETAFDPAPGYPGYGWTKDGNRVTTQEIVSASGPDHCGWGSATFLTIGWPPGTLAATFSSARQYIRDPNGVVRASLRDALVRHATLPSDAHPTGYRTGVVEIFVSPSDQDVAIYLVSPSDVERWPRSDPGVACA